MNIWKIASILLIDEPFHSNWRDIRTYIFVYKLWLLTISYSLFIYIRFEELKS